MPGEKHIALWILSLRFMPPIAVAIPFYLQWQELGLLDTYSGLIIVYIAFNLPFAIWLLRGFLADVPRGTGGGGDARRTVRLADHRRIVVPVILPGVAVDRDLHLRVHLERVPDGADADLGRTRSPCR